jgi:hypothetical protein
MVGGLQIEHEVTVLGVLALVMGIVASILFDRSDKTLREMKKAARSSKRLAKVDAAVDDFEAQGLVGIDRHFVIDPRIGGYLETALLASPLFCEAH